MKNLIRISTFILIFSGLLLIKQLFHENELLTWIHILLGLVYAVLFLLFTIDHIGKMKNDLFKFTPKRIAGNVQFILGLIIIGSGFLIYLYGSKSISPWSEIHLWATIAFILSSIGHFIFKEDSISK